MLLIRIVKLLEKTKLNYRFGQAQKHFFKCNSRKQVLNRYDQIWDLDRKIVWYSGEGHIDAYHSDRRRHSDRFHLLKN